MPQNNLPERIWLQTEDVEIIADNQRQECMVYKAAEHSEFEATNDVFVHFTRTDLADAALAEKDREIERLRDFVKMVAASYKAVSRANPVQNVYLSIQSRAAEILTPSPAPAKKEGE